MGGQTGNGVYRTKGKVKVCRWQSKSPFSRLSDRKKEKEGDAGCWQVTQSVNFNITVYMFHILGRQEKLTLVAGCFTKSLVNLKVMRTAPYLAFW